MKTRTKINIIISSALLGIALLLCLIVGFAKSATTAHAASVTGVQTISASEYTNHNLENYSVFIETAPESYTETISTNTGIKIYGTSNNNANSATDTIKVDCSTMYIDFSSANTLYVPDYYVINGDYNYYEKSYSFQILKGSTVKWYANYSHAIREEQKTNSSGNTYTVKKYDKILNVNGNSSTTTGDSNTYLQFCPTDFGKQLIGLDDGTYTIQITRNYICYQYYGKAGIFPMYAHYDTTSTLTATLIVDTTAPTMNIRGY